MKVDIWSDIRCPYCYIGKRKFEKALSQFPQRDKVEVEWKSFELDPTLRSQAGTNLYDYLAERKHISHDASKQLHQNVAESAREVGLTYDFEHAVIANSFDAHRLIQFANRHGLGDAAQERLFKAYFTEGKDISDRLTLIILGDEIGLDGRLIKQMLDSDELADEVNHDKRKARGLGINSVPYFVFNNRHGVSGAQQPEVFLKTLEKSWQEYEKENLQVEKVGQVQHAIQ